VSTPNADNLIGQTIGPYVIAARIGGGGMGVVYQARDTKLGRTVALKFLPPQWSHDEDARQRFIREAQAASATNHPNICTIHDIATAPDGQLFIVMAYYEGKTLKQRLASGPLSVDESLDIATQIADGLAKAHAQGVVHRDVKPGNVILTEDGARIVDFGLATFANALKLTVEHSTFGTAAYMSPEQVRGQSADARSDVWAVGVILYEMLTGHVPFQGSHAEAIAYAIRNETPEPIRSTRPDIREEIEQVVFRAMHKEPSIRFANGRILARALREVRGQSLPLDLRTEAVTLPLPRPIGEKRRRSLRRIWATAAVLAAVTAGASTYLAWPVARTSIVVAPFGNQTGDTDLDQYRLALTHSLTASLRDAPDLSVTPYSRLLEIVRRFEQEGSDVSSRDAIQAITANTQASWVVVPTLLRDGGSWRARVELRDPRTANSIWTHETTRETSSLTHEVAHRLTSILAEDIDARLSSRRTATVKALLGLLPFGRRERPGHVRSLEVAKALADGIGWYDDLEYAKARQAFRTAANLDARNPLVLAWLSRVALVMRDENAALDAAERSLPLLTAEVAPVDAVFVEAVAAEARRDLATAERKYRALRAQRPDDPSLVMELAGFFDRQARNADAVVEYHEALRLDERLLRPQLELCRMYSPSRLNEPASARTHGGNALDGYRTLGTQAEEGQSLLCLADVLALGRDEQRVQAGTLAQAALKLFEELDYDYSAARAEYYLALVAAMQGRFKESVAIGEKALVRARDAGNIAVQATLMSNLGAAHVSLGNRAQGADYYQQAYKLYQSWRDESRAARIQANRGALLIESGRAAEGLLDVKNALSVVERLGDTNFQTYCLRILATYYRNQGRHADALRELNKALAIAKERNLADNVTVMTTFVALSQFETGDYRDAIESLRSALKDGSGRLSSEARIRLARTYIRMGSLTLAATELERAESELRTSPNEGLQVLFLLVRGEWELESGQPREAQATFERAVNAWQESSPEPAVVEARAYFGILTARAGHVDAGRRSVRAALEAAERLGYRDLEARCRLLLTEIEVTARRFNEARSALDAIPPDSQEQTIGPELRAESHYWRGRLQAESGDSVAAQRSTDAARTIVRDVSERLPDEYRASFLARATLRHFQ